MTTVRIANLTLFRTQRNVEPREYRLDWLTWEDDGWTQHRRYLWREDGEAMIGGSIQTPAIQREVFGGQIPQQYTYEGVMHPVIKKRVVNGVLPGEWVCIYPNGLRL